MPYWIYHHDTKKDPEFFCEHSCVAILARYRNYVHSTLAISGVFYAIIWQFKYNSRHRQ